MGLRRPLGGVLLLCSGLHACAVEPYRCFEDSQCSRQGEHGVCAGSYCAYSASSCESGLRYSDNAAFHLADECVDSGGASSESSSDEGSSSSSSTDPLPAVCGDGNLDPGEDCDDGNLRSGDGCTSACRLSGSERWTRIHQGPAGADDRAVAVLVRDDGSVVVAGEQGEAEGMRSGLALAYDERDGDFIAAWIAEEPSDRRLHGLATDGTTLMVVGDQPAAGTAGERAWYARLGALLEPEALGAIDTLADESGRGAAFTTWGFVLVGAQDGHAWARWVEADLPDWHGDALLSVEVVAARGDGAFVIVGPTAADPWHWWVVSPHGVQLQDGASDADQIHAAGFDGEGRLLLGGVKGGTTWLEARQPDGALAFGEAGLGPSGGSVDGLAGVPGGGIYAVGRVDDGIRGWVGRYRADGTERWSAVIEGAGELELDAAVYDHHADALYVAGAVRSSAGDLDLLVMALEP